jgi:hypothetical protein
MMVATVPVEMISADLASPNEYRRSLEVPQEEEEAAVEKTAMKQLIQQQHSSRASEVAIAEAVVEQIETRTERVMRRNSVLFERLAKIAMIEQMT